MHNPSRVNARISPVAADRAAALPHIKIPTRDQAIEIPWDSTMAKSRGIYGFDSMDPRSRSFNLIRRRMLEMHAEHGWRLFGVVSATPNVGKSFITGNIAAALSRDPGFETCAVDLDLRRGALSKLFGIEPHGCILEFLNGAFVQAPSVYALESERLLVMPTTGSHIRSAELLAGERASALLQSMRMADPKALYLCDLPPAFANDDSATIISKLDAYILVAEEGKTRERELLDTVDMLGSDRLAGVVLNKYRGGVISEGYGIADYYASGYQ